MYAAHWQREQAAVSGMHACEGPAEDSMPRGNMVSMKSSKLRAAASPPSPACLPRRRLQVAWLMHKVFVMVPNTC